jgi:hypothetical protein
MDIEHNEIVLGSMQDEVLLVFAGIALDLAENTPATLRVSAAASGDVLTAPGSPKPVQVQLPRICESYKIGGWRVSSGLLTDDASEDVRAEGPSSLINSLSSLPGLK